MGINIAADFGEDYKQFILLSIKKYFNINLEDDKYSYLKDLELQDLYFQYLSNSKRIPPAKPRKVYLSKELINSDLYNTYKDKVDNITELLKSGQSIKPYLNRDVKHIFKKNCPKDFLLNDWDLYHLHLGELKPNANFCDRTKYVLFCRITNNDVYLIQILDHTEDSSFACRQLLTIIRDNWIEQYNVYKLNGVLGMEREFSDIEYRKLREAGECTILNIDGDYCISPNMGIASSGDSCRDVDIAMRQFHLLEVLQEHILNSSKRNYDFIIRCNIRHKKPTKIHLKLKHIEDNILIAQDIYSKTIIELKMDKNYIIEMTISLNQNQYKIRYIE